MDISLSIIKEKLKKFNPVTNNISSSKSFDDILLYSSDMKEVKSNILYVCTLDDIVNSKFIINDLYLLKRNSMLYNKINDIYFVCTGDYSKFEKISDNFTCNIIFIPESISKYQIFSLLSEVFIFYEEWETKMMLALNGKNPLDGTIDLMSSVIDDFIFVYDASFGIIGSVKNRKSGIKEIDSSIENNFFSPEAVQILKSLEADKPNSSFKGYFTSSVNDSHNIIMKQFYLFSTVTATLCIIYKSEKLSDEKLHILKESIKYIEKALSYKQNIYTSNTSAYEYFLIDLLEGKISDEDAVKNKAGYTKLNFNGRFKLLKIEFDDFSYTKANSVIFNFRTSYPYSKVFIYSKYVIVLLEEDKNNILVDNSNEKLNDLKILFRRNRALCGISTSFSCLTQLKNSFDECSYAINFGKTLNPDKTIYFYDDYFVYHILDNYSKNMDTFPLINKNILKILNLDAEQKNDNFELLEIYLNNNKSITKTAQKMNLHRNSIIYRIDKIRNILGCDLNDSETILKLLLSFKIIKLNSIKKPT